MRHHHTVFAIMTVSVLAQGCSSSPTQAPTPYDGLLEPPPEGQGVQYGFTTTVGPGEEVEHCAFVQAPPEGLLVNRDEVGYSFAGHHFTIHETSFAEIPVDGVFPCDSGVAGLGATRIIGGSNIVTGRGTTGSSLTFPDHVALSIPPNAVLIMSGHYINPTTEPVEAESRINLWTIPESQMEIEGDVLFTYNHHITVPQMGTARARMRCPVYDDITITAVTHHMHARGVHFAAAVDDGAPFYESDEWEDLAPQPMEGGFEVKAGSTFDYWCDYENPEARDVQQGLKSTDEMCQLIGTYYPASRGTALCSADPTAPLRTQHIGGEWVGTGEVECSESMACIASACEDGCSDELQKCVTASREADSVAVSDAVRCIYQGGDVASCAAVSGC